MSSISAGEPEHTIIASNDVMSTFKKITSAGEVQDSIDENPRGHTKYLSQSSNTSTRA
jgi:hypothetical protein